MSATWILADAHGGQDPRIDRALVELLDRARGRASTLLVLGDLFTAWLGPARFHTPLQREVVARLEALRAHGTRVELAIGNRDYLMDALVGSAFDQLHDGEALVDVAGVPTLVTHGDRVNPADRAYLLWHHLSRSAAARAVLAVLPGAAGRALASKTERGLDATNQAYKTGLLPLGALEALGRRAASRGAARALVGHFHHDRVLDVAGGVPVVVAPGFVDHRRILVASTGGALASVPLAAL
ncbi:hypothetical protein L6R52_39440 [Myxococcota bacterium]|nr:hypothetical protein [Myxococcota bacterium]